MFKGLTTYGSTKFLEEIKGKQPLFLCTIATTETSTIPGVSGAGASSELTEYTPAADVELMIHGELRCLDEIPQTVVGEAAAPTPVLITKASVELSNTPFLVVDAGSRIKADVPSIRVSDDYGKDIRTGKAVENPAKIFDESKKVAKELSKMADYLVIGESVPGGTTTALGALTALGYTANTKVSGSMPENPHDLKWEVVKEGLLNSNLGLESEEAIGNISIGDIDPFKAVATIGDPMMACVAGMVFGSEVPVLLAGGTQMAAVCGLIKAIDPEFDFSKVYLGTTVFVAKDETSDIMNILKQIGDINIGVVDPDFENSRSSGLKNYFTGFVKEGAGAGGAMLMALLCGYPIEKIREESENLVEGS